MTIYFINYQFRVIEKSINIKDLSIEIVIGGHSFLVVMLPMN